MYKNIYVMNFIESIHLNLAQLAIFKFPNCLTGVHQMDNRQKLYFNLIYHILKRRKRHGHNQK